MSSRTLQNRVTRVERFAGLRTRTRGSEEARYRLALATAAASLAEVGLRPFAPPRPGERIGEARMMAAIAAVSAALASGTSPAPLELA